MVKVYLLNHCKYSWKIWYFDVCHKSLTSHTYVSLTLIKVADMPPLSPTVQKLSQHNLTESSRYFSISCHLEKPGSVARNMTGKFMKTTTNAQRLLKVQFVLSVVIRCMLGTEQRMNGGFMLWWHINVSKAIISYHWATMNQLIKTDIKNKYWMSNSGFIGHLSPFVLNPPSSPLLSHLNITQQ